MNRKKTGSILLGAALVAVLAAAALLYRNVSKNGGAGAASAASSSAPALSSQAAPSSAAQSGAAGSSQAAEQAPDFTVYDGDGNAVKLSDFRGKPVVLNFWASWCGYCTKELPDFQEIYKKEKDKINFLFVNWTDGQQETKEKARAFLKENGYDLPVYYDLDQDAVAQYGLTGIPATAFIDRNGNLVSGRVGIYDRESLEKEIARLLG